eukprot:10324893-Alexandrium_andersonii.AAC.1
MPDKQTIAPQAHLRCSSLALPAKGAAIASRSMLLVCLPCDPHDSIFNNSGSSLHLSMPCARKSSRWSCAARCPSVYDKRPVLRPRKIRLK